MEINDSDSISQDSKNIAVITWIATIFFHWLPGLIFYLIKKDDPYIQDQAKEALNWSLTATTLILVGAILCLIFIGFFVIVSVFICNLVFCIMGAVAASNGRTFRVPFAIRFIK